MSIIIQILKEIYFLRSLKAVFYEEKLLGTCLDLLGHLILEVCGGCMEHVILQMYMGAMYVAVVPRGC